MRNKWLLGSLGLSVIVNLLLIGFIAGRVAMAPMPGISPDPTAGYGRLLRFLPDERRDHLAPVMRRHMHDVMNEIRSIRTEQKAVFEALSAEPYDPARLTAALSELRASLAATQEASHRSLVEVAGSLSAQERRQLATTMRRPHHGVRPFAAKPAPPAGP